MPYSPPMATPAQARHVFLIGFMATGKSTVGRILANLLGRDFVDLDEAIEAEAQQTVAEIFAAEGESGFRRREADVLARVMAGPAAVVATGGGAPCHGDSLDRMRERGLVVALTATLPVVLARARLAGTDDSAREHERPLLVGPEAQVRALMQRREPIYRQAHVSLETEDVEPMALGRRLVDLVVHAEALPEHSLAQASLVALSSAIYPVIVASGELDHLGSWLERAMGDRRPTKVAIVSDRNVAPLYGERALASLAGAGFDASMHVVPAGEEAKCIGELARLAEGLVAAGLDRRSVVLALGGGVVGDLAGFAAACLYRGVACVQVPTTLLAMIDSAIGGKTGINLDAGKNLMGAFWQPSLVLADPDVLTTLPARERRAAFGELIKYALLDGEDLYAAVDALAPAVAGDALDTREVMQPLAGVIRRCAAIKSWIVTRDEREQTGERALLNLGHTVGHAIEAATGYQRLLHGEAVALGLIAACRVSARLGLCDPALEGRVAQTVRCAGLDADVDRWLDPATSGDSRGRVVDYLVADKKRRGGRVGFITVHQVGRCNLTEIDLGELQRILLP